MLSLSGDYDAQREYLSGRPDPMEVKLPLVQICSEDDNADTRTEIICSHKGPLQTHVLWKKLVRPLSITP